jgi:hypothetical protein
MAWATTDDCVTYAGSVPVAAPPMTSDGAGTLALAQSIIETTVNRTEDANGSMRTRDLKTLARAVAFQAIWLPSQPDLLSRVGAQGVSQDGLTAQFRSAADQLLAPLAQRALKNLSWMGTRSVRFGTRTPRLPDRSLAGYTASTFLSSGADPDYLGWEPLGGGH